MRQTLQEDAVACLRKVARLRMVLVSLEHTLIYFFDGGFNVLDICPDSRLIDCTTRNTPVEMLDVMTILSVRWATSRIG